MKYTVLIVEDEASMRSSLADALRDAGFNVLQASDGETGLTTALKEHPDLILLDIGLPKMDGMAVLDSLRKDVWGKNACVIILTVHAEMDTIAEAMEHGMFDYILKSSESLDDIVVKVRSKLEK